MLDQLTVRIRCRLARDNDTTRPTGVPPHVTLLNHMHSVADEFKRIVPKIESIVPGVIEGVIQVLEERAIGAGTVTRDGLTGLLHEVLRDAGLFDIVQRLNSGDPRQLTAPSSQPVANVNEPRVLHMWEGAFHRLPEDFVFETAPVYTMWLLWRFGNTEKGYAPYRELQPNDLKNTDARKRLCDLKYLMRIVEDLIGIEELQGELTIENAASLYSGIEHQLWFPNHTERSRQRRSGQLSWKSVVNMIRVRGLPAQSVSN